MEIGCTKKLLDTLKIKPVLSQEENMFFSWSANVLVIARKKAVVVVNNQNRFGFVLYGLKAKDFSQLNVLITEGIRRCLKEEHIKESVIDQYLNDANPLTFTKTKDRTAVARLNKVCGNVALYIDLLDPSSLYQTEVTKKINNDLFKSSATSDYAHSYESLLQNFKSAYDGPIISIEAADLMIKLDLGSRSAYRRLIVPLSITLKDLHQVIQAAFEWENRHLHDFKVYDGRGVNIKRMISKHEKEMDMHDERVLCDEEVQLLECFDLEHKMVYCYDYGDFWQHEISFKGLISDYDKNHASCILGEGRRPPEDVGGILGYEHYLEVIQDPTHPEHDHMKSWAHSLFYRPFDIEFINKKLKYALR